MVRALFFLLIAFRVTVCPVVCASGGDVGYCCHGCSHQASGGQQDKCCGAKPAFEPDEEPQHHQELQVARSGCECCRQEECRGEDAACDRLAEESYLSDAAPKAPAREDGICHGDCACKVLPEKDKLQIEFRTCFVIGNWNCADARAYAIRSCSPSIDTLDTASPPDGKAVRISRCSLLI